MENVAPMKISDKLKQQGLIGVSMSELLPLSIIRVTTRSGNVYTIAFESPETGQVAVQGLKEPLLQPRLMTIIGLAVPGVSVVHDIVCTHFRLRMIDIGQNEVRTSTITDIQLVDDEELAVSLIATARENQNIDLGI